MHMIFWGVTIEPSTLPGHYSDFKLSVLYSFSRCPTPTLCTPSGRKEGNVDILVDFDKPTFSCARASVMERWPY